MLGLGNFSYLLVKKVCHQRLMLNRKIFYGLQETKVLIGMWR